MNIHDAQFEKEELRKQRDNLLPPKTKDAKNIEIQDPGSHARDSVKLFSKRRMGGDSKRLSKASESKSRLLSSRDKAGLRKGASATKRLESNPEWRNIRSSLKKPSSERLSKMARLEKVKQLRLDKNATSSKLSKNQVRMKMAQKKSMTTPEKMNLMVLKTEQRLRGA